MNSTSNGTQILPGSNNSSTAGRAIDTYDRHYDGRQGNGTEEGVDYEHLHLARTGQLTEAGYQQDGFVVDDDELEPENSQLEESEEDEAMSDEEESEEDDSDYEEQSTSEDESEADESEDDE